MYSATGKILTIDLTTQTTGVLHIPDETTIKYLGGRALGARLLYDYLPPHVDPLGPENVIFILTGVACGTMIPSSRKYAVMTKSPLTGTFLDTYSSGYMSYELKAAGWDGLMITGKSEKPVYLYIKNDKVEFRDASHIWGKGTFETEETIIAETDPNAGLSVIGPAGEKLVLIASINSEHYRQAARGGGGAVYGSKLLKGIAVRGTGSIKVADHEALRGYFLRGIDFMEHNKTSIARRRYGTPMTMNITNEAGMLPTKNFQHSHSEEAVGEIDADGCEKFTLKSRACRYCPVGCSKITKVTEGRYKGEVLEGPEYETNGLLGPNLGITYLPAVITENARCDEWGVDTISAGVTIGFVMECYEKGLLTEEEIGVKNPSFGNDEAAIEMIRMMSFREGFGDKMAQGVKKLAEYVGHDSIKFAMQVKGLEFPSYDPRAGYASGLGYAVNPRGACHRRCWPPALEVLGGAPRYTEEGKAAMVARIYDENTILHSMLICDLANKFSDLTIPHCVEYLTAVTGHAFTEDDLWAVAARAETLARMINCREGFSRKDDTLPDRILNEPTPDGPGKGHVFTQEKLDRMLDEYYEIRGWDNEGYPLPETLERLGIEKCREEKYEYHR